MPVPYPPDPPVFSDPLSLVEKKRDTNRLDDSVTPRLPRSDAVSDGLTPESIVFWTASIDQRGSDFLSPEISPLVYPDLAIPKNAKG